MDLLDFDENGLLKPYDVILSDLPTFKDVFVEKIALSQTRKALFESYLRYLETIRSVIPSDFYQWIDGSFVTKKQNPNDIDVVTFINYQDFERNLKAFDMLRKWRFDRKMGIDGYFVPIFPENHRKYSNFTIEQREWLFLFSKDRHKNNKGIIQISF